MQALCIQRTNKNKNPNKNTRCSTQRETQKNKIMIYKRTLTLQTKRVGVA
jgi:hypothetical protein